jgi:hypothetical protein
MKNTYYVRNPQTGLLEVKEFAADSQLALLRVSDPVATALVQGYTNAEVVGDKLFTSVRMAKETGRFPAFGKEAFIIPANIKRAIGERVQRVQVQTGYITMSLSEYALGVAIENRERNEWAGSPDMLLNGKLLTVTQKISLYREKLQAILATTAGNYAAGLAINGSGKAWATTGDPVQDMLDLNYAILKQNGRMANKAWFSPGAWLLFINNTAVLNRIKYGGEPITPAQMSPAAAAQLLQVDEVLIGKAVYGTGSDGGVKKSAPTMSFIWESVQANNAGLMIVGSGAGIEPAFGYTWERLNSPVVESYYENQTKSQVWDYEHFFDPAITLNSAGGLYYSLA